MATHSSVLAWRIPGMGEPGGLPSMGSHRVGHDWSDLAAAGAAGDLGSIPGSGRSPEEGNGPPLQNIIAWKIPWAVERGGLQSMGSRGVRHDRVTSLWFSLSCIGEGHGNPLQCSCLENPREGGAWLAAVSGVAQNWTWLRRLCNSSSNCHITCNVHYVTLLTYITYITLITYKDW